MVALEKIELAVRLHDEFREDNRELYKRTVNGAGPAKYGHIIRDTWFCGFSTGHGANVHDYLYSLFADPEQFSRREADAIFLALMLKDLGTGSLWSRILNTPVIYAFWGAVRLFGGLFWKK